MFALLEERDEQFRIVSEYVDLFEEDRGDVGIGDIIGHCLILFINC